LPDRIQAGAEVPERRAGIVAPHNQKLLRKGAATVYYGFVRNGTDTGEPPNMSIEAHLAELERRHRALEAEIAEARAHPSIDNLEIVELKRRKLLVKDEIARLQQKAAIH
jgi:hypothetical protein